MGTSDVTKAKDTKRLSQVFFGQAPCTPGRSEVLWLCRLMDKAVQVVEGTILIKGLHERTLR